MAEIDEFLRVLDQREMETDPDEALEIPLGKSPSLSEQCISYEGKLIKQALMLTNGSIPEAASFLTLTPEHLTVILELRHRDLLAWAERERLTVRAELKYSPIIFHDAA